MCLKTPSYQTLWCLDNGLTQLDVRSCTGLMSFICDGNQLTELDVTRNTMLSTPGLLRQSAGQKSM